MDYLRGKCQGNERIEKIRKTGAFEIFAEADLVGIAAVRFFVPSAGEVKGFANRKILKGVGHGMRKFGMRSKMG